MPGGRPLEMPPPRPPSMWARSARRSAALWRDWERPLRTTGRWRGSPESAYLAVRQLSTTTLPKPRSRADGQTPASPGGDQSTVKYSGGWAEAVYPNGSTPAPNDVGSDGRSDSVADDISGHGRRRSAHDTQQHWRQGSQAAASLLSSFMTTLLVIKAQQHWRRCSHAAASLISILITTLLVPRAQQHWQRW